MYIFLPFNFTLDHSTFCTRSLFCRVQPQFSTSLYTSSHLISGALYSLDPTIYPFDPPAVDPLLFRSTPLSEEVITNHSRRVQNILRPTTSTTLSRSTVALRIAEDHSSTCYAWSTICWKKSCGKQHNQLLPPLSLSSLFNNFRCKLS
jgi:hypothetical protein